MLTRVEKLPLKELVLFGWMPNRLKRMVYSLRGYKIGKNVKFSFGSVVVGTDVTIGDDVKIGMLSILSGRQIVLADRVQIGMMSVLSTAVITIGEATRINNQVVVGGMQTPRSALHMGSNCILMEWSFINTSEPVTIGNDVGIGGHCLFFTHGLWPNGFDGNPVRFAPITIEDEAWIAWRVTVLAGSKVGHGAIVSADACVSGRIAAGALAVGNPAKATREDYSFRREATPKFKADLLRKLIADYVEWCRFHGIAAEVDHEKYPNWIKLHDKSNKVHNLIFVWEDGLPPVQNDSDIDLLVSLQPLSAARRSQLAVAGICWLDISSRMRSRKGSEVADDFEEFCRRFGLRTLRSSSDSDRP